MIKSEREYRITLEQRARLAAGLELLRQARASGGEPDPLRFVEEVGLKAQVEELQGEIRDYERLRNQGLPTRDVTDLADLPTMLVMARIANGLTEEELAERLGLAVDELRDHEENEYVQADPSLLIRASKQLDLAIRPSDVRELGCGSARRLLSRGQEIGVPKELVLQRLLPPAAAELLERRNDTAGLRLQLVKSLGRVFRLSPRDLLGNTALQVDARLALGARFKMPKNVDVRRNAAYAVYAHYLGLLVLEATPSLRGIPLPGTAEDFRSSLLRGNHALSFRAILASCWRSGLPVLPLTDPGGFSGACWQAGGRVVLVIKQRTRFSSRWQFDLLHELWHAIQMQTGKKGLVVEADDVSGLPQADLREEKRASRFAGDVLLGNRAEDLVNICVKEARGNLRLFKSVVQRVATAEKVPVAALANYMAYRLSLQGVNWWGAANNLQDGTQEPWRTAIDLLLENASLDRLNPLDRRLLTSALREAW